MSANGPITWTNERPSYLTQTEGDARYAQLAAANTFTQAEALPTAGVTIGGDVNLYRVGVNIGRADDSLEIGCELAIRGQAFASSGLETALPVRQSTAAEVATWPSPISSSRWRTMGSSSTRRHEFRDCKLRRVRGETGRVSIVES